MANPAFPQFESFLASVERAQPAAYAAHPATRVSERAEFDAMQSHVLGLYEGVEVQHSFVDLNGQIFDCLPIEQQPSLRDARGPIARPPDAPRLEEERARISNPDLPIPAPLSAERTDRFGHAMVCPPGTIPMRRVTLAELTKWETLGQAFKKSPWGGRHPRLGAGEARPDMPARGQHKYAHAYQTTSTLGGRSNLNLWAPAVGSEIFSLSQQWHAGGSPVQTVEIGWQVYPGKYGTTNPVLFIYWTADGYQHTGNYNLDSPAFVQINSAWALGGAVGPLSVYGGAQYSLEMGAYLSGGNWWLYVGGGSSGNAIGYYPASQYGTGPLGTHAEDIDFGGEVVDNTAWPAMGSGRVAADGWQRAAYQRDIVVFPRAGGAEYCKLTLSQPSAPCYTIELHTAADPWNDYFFFGGPGGTSCP
jgi:hypothetical protein